jgi:hypothetical protein
MSRFFDVMVTRRLPHPLRDLREELGVAFNKIEAALSAEANAEDGLPRMAYLGDSSVGIIPVPGDSAASAVILLPDGSYRTLAFPATFDPSVVGPGGLDTGSEAPSTFYYLYAVPTEPTGDVLHILGSASPPTTGPTGFSVYRYLGAVYNNSGSNITPFLARSSKVSLASARTILDLGIGDIATEANPVAVDLSDFIPLTAGAVVLEASLKADVGDAGFVELYIDGFESLNSHLQLLATDTEWNFEIAEFETPGTPKQLFRRLEETSGDLESFKIFCLGWVDEWLE